MPLTTEPLPVSTANKELSATGDRSAQKKIANYRHIAILIYAVIFSDVHYVHVHTNIFLMFK